MFKTTVYLPEALRRRLRRIARQQGVSEAELIRRALELLPEPAPRRPRLPLFDSKGALLAEHVDEELRKGFGRQ